MKNLEHIQNVCYTVGVMEQHALYMETLQDMLCDLRERQSSWRLTDEERRRMREGIEALEAAKQALSVQVYA